MITCDDTPVPCEKQSTEGTMSVTRVLFPHSLLLCGASSLRDIQLPIRLASDCETSLGLLRAHPAQTKRRTCCCCCSDFCLLVELAGPPNIYPDPLSALLDSRLGFGPVRSIVCWHLSFVSPTAAHISLDSSLLMATLPVSSLFAQPTFNVTITPTTTAVTNSATTVISSVIAPPSIAAAASVVTLASSSTSSAAATATSVLLPSAAPVVRADTQLTVLTVTLVTANPSTQTSSTLVVSTIPSYTRATSRRRKAEPHSQRTQPKGTAREQPTSEVPIMLDSSGEAPATSSATSTTATSIAIATTAVASMPNLLTAAEDESMHVRPSRIAKFAYAGSRSSTLAPNPLRISNSPPAAENSAAPSSESDAPTRALTPPPLAVGNSAVTGVSEYSGSTALLDQFAYSYSRLREQARPFCVRDEG